MAQRLPTGDHLPVDKLLLPPKNELLLLVSQAGGPLILGSEVLGVLDEDSGWLLGEGEEV